MVAGVAAKAKAGAARAAVKAGVKARDLRAGNPQFVTGARSPVILLNFVLPPLPQ
jgi:hypothetical protein